MEIITAIFLVIFQTTDEFVIVFVTLILGKVGIEKFTGQRRQIDSRYEFGLKTVLKGLEPRRESDVR